MTHHRRPGFGSKRREGMTLVEVVVAMLLLGIASAGMYQVAIMANRTSAKARSRYIAVNIAKNRLEQIKSRDFSQLDRFLESNAVVNTDGYLSQNGEFRRTTFVSGAGTGLVEVTVMVGVRDRATEQFLDETESVSMQLTDFQERPR